MSCPYLEHKNRVPVTFVSAMCSCANHPSGVETYWKRYSSLALSMTYQRSVFDTNTSFRCSVSSEARTALELCLCARLGTGNQSTHLSQTLAEDGYERRQQQYVCHYHKDNHELDQLSVWLRFT